MDQVQNFFDITRNKKRGVAFMRVRVHNRDTMHLPLPDGNLVPRGVHEISIYEDSLPLLEALVEGPDRIARAREQYNALIARQVIDALPPERGVDANPDEIIKMIADRSDPVVNATLEGVLSRTEHSLQSSYRQLFNRDTLPLDKVEVLERGIPEPQRQEGNSERDAIITAVAAAIAGANTAMSQKIEELSQKLEIVASENADLRKQIGNRKG